MPALGAIAGFVDAVGYLVIGHVFLSNMTGNLDSVGIHVARSEWPDAVRRAAPIVPFLAGTAAGGVLRGYRARNVFQTLLLAELLLLCGFGALRVAVPADPGLHAVDLLSIALLSLAMGLQNTSLLGAQGFTTHVTGSLTRVGVALGARLRGRRPQVARGARRGAHLVLGFAAGALLGALAQRALGPSAIFVPAAALVAVLVAARAG